MREEENATGGRDMMNPNFLKQTELRSGGVKQNLKKKSGIRRRDGGKTRHQRTHAGGGKHGFHRKSQLAPKAAWGTDVG